jgi:hypothetical protein
MYGLGAGGPAQMALQLQLSKQGGPPVQVGFGEQGEYVLLFGHGPPGGVSALPLADASTMVTLVMFPLQIKSGVAQYAGWTGSVMLGHVHG